MIVASLRSTFCLTAISCIAFAGATSAANLSPERWPATQRTAAEQAEARSPSPQQAQTFNSSTGIVVSTLSPVAALAGVQTLKNGGNAADAAITATLTQITRVLGANISFAGIAEIEYYEARSGRTMTLNAGWDTWSGEKDRASIPLSPLIPAVMGGGNGSSAAASGAAGRGTLVPGFMAGMGALHKRFGHLGFADLFAPAIYYADQGITLSPLLAAYFQAYSHYLSATDAGQQFLQQSGSSSPRAGEPFKQPGLAATLRAVARNGAREMYTGTWAREFVGAVSAAGGKASLDDLKRYRVQWIEPAVGHFQGYEVGVSPLTLGGPSLLEALALIENTGLVKAPDYTESAQSLLDLSRIIAWSTIAVDRPEALAPYRAAGIDVSLAGRQTPAYATAVAPALHALFQGPSLTSTTPVTPHTASVVVVDKDGNIAVLIHTSNTVAWGSTGLVVGGIPIPEAAGLTAVRFPAVLAMATSGSSFLQETVKVVFETLAKERDLRSALAAPPLLMAGAQSLQVPSGAYSADQLAALRGQGIQIRECDAPEVLTLKGTPTVVRLRESVAEAADVPSVFSFSMVSSPK